MPGDILTAPAGEEFRVIECHPETDGDGYVIEVEAILPLPAEKIAGIQRLVKDSNEAVLGAYLERLAEQVVNGTVSPSSPGFWGYGKKSGLTRNGSGSSRKGPISIRPWPKIKHRPKP